MPVGRAKDIQSLRPSARSIGKGLRTSKGTEKVVDVRLLANRQPRWSPELLAAFREHQRRWREGEINLIDFCREWRADGTEKWYASPLGDYVWVDKAVLYDLLGFKPSLPQCLFLASCDKIKVYSGGARAGKSFVTAKEVLPVLLTPGKRVWLVAPEYTIAKPEFEYLVEDLHHEELESMIGDMLATKNGGRIINRPKQGHMEIRLDWGPGFKPDVRTTELHVISDKTPDKQRGASIDYMVLCEGALIKEERIPNLQMRLTDRQGIMTVPSTPSGIDWTSKLFFAGINGDPGHFSIQADSRMNPMLDLDDLMFRSQKMSDEEFNENIRGVPTPKFGLVYKDFMPELHVDPWEDSWPRPAWRIGRGVDFGYTDPFCVLWIAVEREQDGEHTYYVFDEYYRKGKTIPDVTKEMSKREGWTLEQRPGGYKLTGTPRFKPFMTVTDWDAQCRAEMQRSGWAPMMRAEKDIQAGIQTVQHLLRPREDGRPRLFIAPRCKYLRQELMTYSWLEKAETPEDKNNHALDALRYFVHTLRPRGKVEVRSLNR